MHGESVDCQNERKKRKKRGQGEAVQESNAGTRCQKRGMPAAGSRRVGGVLLLSQAACGSRVAGTGKEARLVGLTAAAAVGCLKAQRRRWRAPPP